MKLPKRRRLERRTLQPELLEARIAPATLFVDNTNDAGPGSLRQAILTANSTLGADDIRFDGPSAAFPTTGPLVISLQTPLPVITETLTIDGYTATGTSKNTANIGSNAVLRIMLDGSLAGGNGLVFFEDADSNANGSVVRGLVISGFSPGVNESGFGVFIKADNVTVAGNFIGTDSTGTQIFNAVGSSGTPISGNRNAGVGIGLFGGTGSYDANVIGGINPEDRNVLSGNSLGISLSTFAQGTSVFGNLIGTDKTGTVALPNDNAGIRVGGGATIIGGTDPGAGNVISGNNRYGIDFGVGSGLTIQGNLIGVMADGTTPLPNQGPGIRLQNSGSNVVIGGAVPGAGNVIAANLGVGIQIGSDVGDGPADNVTVQGNFIGTDKTGIRPLGNQGGGIDVTGSVGSVIGGTNAGQGNVIVFNNGAGIRVSQETGPSSVRISGNGIHSNAGLGIDLDGGTQNSFGVTRNDPLDLDGGPNGLLNFPDLVSVVNNGTSVELGATIQGAPNTTYAVEFFALAPNQVDASLYGEGTVFLGSKTVTTNGSGQASVVFQRATSLPANSSFSAVLIDESTGDTSEFSEVIGQPTIVYTWTGTQSSDWFNPQNWTPTGVPGTLDTVLISPIAGNDPVLNADTVITDFNQSGRTLGGTGTLTVRTSYVWGGGAHSGPTVILLDGATGSFGNSAPLQWIKGDLNVFGTLTVTNSGLTFNEGDLYIAPNAGLQLNAGIVDQDGAATFSSVTVEGRVDKIGSGVFGIETIEVKNFGLVQSLAGTLAFQDYSGFAGSRLILNGGNVSSPTNPIRIEADGELHGTGTIAGSVGVVGGYVFPGLGQVPGVLTITQNFVMDASSTLVVDLRGAAQGSYDQVAAGATAAVDGGLIVGFVPGYTPTLGDALNIVTGASRIGTFQSIVGEGLLTADYTVPTAMRLVRNGLLFTWTGASGADPDNWFQPGNWDRNAVPGDTDAALINSAGATINLADGNVTIGDFIQTNGTVTGPNQLTIRGSFQWNGGTQSGTGTTFAQNESSTALGSGSKLLDGRTLYIDGTGISNGGAPLVLANNGQLRIGDLFALQNTTPFQTGSGGGRINIDSEAILRKTATGNVVIPAGLTLQNAGTLDIANGTLRIEAAGNSLGALFNVAPGAVLEFNSTAGFGLNLSSTIGGGGTAKLIGGVLDLESGTFANAKIEAGTTLSIEGGVFTASASSETIQIDGTLNFLAGAFTGSVQANVAGAFNISGAGTKSISKWHVAVNGGGQWGGASSVTLSNGASLDVGGSIFIDSNFTIVNGTDGGTLSVVQGGTLEVDDATVVIGVSTNNSGAFRSVGAGDVTFGGGFMQNDGSLFIDDGSSVGAPTPLLIDGGIVFGEGTIDGSVESSAGLFAPGPDDGSTGILTITGDYTQASDAELLIRARGTSPGGGYSQLVVGGAASLDGKLTFEAIGVFAPPASSTFNVLMSTGTRTGTFTNTDLPPGADDDYTPNGASVVFAAANVFVWDGGGGNSAWDNPLNWDLDLSFPGTADTAILSINSTIDLGSISRTVTSFQISAGTLTGAADLNVTGSLTWNGGGMSGNGATIINAGATATLGGSIDKQLIARTLNNAGTLDWSGTGQLVLDGATIDNSGVFNLLSDATMSVFGLSTFNNLAGGTLEKSGGIGTSTISIGIGVNNDGTIRVVDGKIDLGSAFIQTSGITELAGGDLQAASALIFDGGELRGSGVIGADVTNNGATVRPGGTLAAGTLTIVNNYTQGTGGTLAVELGGVNPGQFDVLDVDGTTTLGGTLDIARIASFVPAPGNQFRVVQTANNPGMFGSLTGASAGLSQAADGTGLVLTSGAAAETDVSLTGGNLVITDINGGTSNDALTITLNGSNVRISDPTNTLVAGTGATQIDPNTVEVPLVAITGNIQVNTLGGDDTLTMALAGGDFLGTLGVTYAAGANGGSGDSLSITGGAQGIVNYSYTSPTNGDISMSNFGGVSFTGLESAVNSGGATDAILDLPTATNTATLSDDGTTGNTLSRLSGATFVRTDFANPSNALTINRGNAADTLTVNALPDFNANLTIGSAAIPFASLNFAGAVNLGTNRSLSATATGNILFSAALTTSGTGNIQLTAGDIAFNGPGSLAGSGEVFLQPFSDASSIGIGAGATGAFNLDATDLAALVNGFVGITIGRGGTGSGAVDINASNFQDAVTIVGGTIDVTGLNAGANNVTLIALLGPIGNGGDVLTDVTGNSVVLSTNGPINGADFIGIGTSVGGGAAGLKVDATTVNAEASIGSIAIESVGTGGVSMSILHKNTFDTGNVFLASSTEDVTITSGQIVGSGGFIVTVTGHNLSANNLSSGPGPFLGTISLTTVTSGDVTVGNAAPGNGTVNVTSAGDIVVNGPIDGSISTIWSAGGSITGAGNVTLAGTSDFDVTANGAINLTGAIEVPGTATFAAGVANDITLVNGGNRFATVSITSGASVSLRDDGGFDLGATNVSTRLSLQSDSTITQSAPITGSGGLTKLGGGRLTLSQSNTYTGTTAINAGTLALNGLIADGSSATDVTVASGATLGGNGLIGGSVSNSGTIQPGGSGAAGTLTISGDYTQDAGGSLVIELGGTSPGSFDVLSVGGVATLAGALDVIELSPFVVSAPSSFAVLPYGSHSGTFTLNAPAVLSITYPVNGAVLEAVIPPALISISDAAIVEGDNGTKQLVFKVTLNQAVPATVTVSYDTAAFSADARSAAAGADYTAVTGGQVIFGPNELSRTIAITLNGDTAAEPTERFNVMLRNATNAGIDDDTGVGAILDDDHHTIAIAEGSGNQVSVYTTTPAGATLVQTFTAFDPKFKGGVRVAVGDVNGDGVDDVIAGAGLGGRAKVRVFDGANNFQPMAGMLGEFAAFGRTYRGGVFVAAGDVDGDGKDDVIVSPSAGSLSRVNIFSGDDGALLNSFRAFGKGTGGVRVSAGDVTGDGLAEIIVGTGVGSSVRVFDALNGIALDTEGAQFRAFGKNYRGGVFVAAGDLNADGKDDIVVSAGAGAPHIRSYLQGIPPLAPKTFDAYTGSKLGARIGVLDINADGIADIISSKGRKGDNLVRVFDGRSTGSMFSISPLSRQPDGLYVG